MKLVNDRALIDVICGGVLPIGPFGCILFCWSGADRLAKPDGGQLRGIATGLFKHEQNCRESARGMYRESKDGG